MKVEMGTKSSACATFSAWFAALSYLTTPAINRRKSDSSKIAGGWPLLSANFTHIYGAWHDLCKLHLSNTITYFRKYSDQYGLWGFFHIGILLAGSVGVSDKCWQFLLLTQGCLRSKRSSSYGQAKEVKKWASQIWWWKSETERVLFRFAKKVRWASIIVHLVKNVQSAKLPEAFSAGCSFKSTSSHLKHQARKLTLSNVKANQERILFAIYGLKLLCCWHKAACAHAYPHAEGLQELCLLHRQKTATWLILPVVICLSQRLSHACLSINKSIPWNCEWLIKSVIVYLIVLLLLG